MAFPVTDTATLHSRTVTGQDSYGNDVYTDVTTDVLGAFAPGASSELIQGQDLVNVQPAFYIRPENIPSVDVRAVDTLTVRGRTYQVDGDVQDWRFGTTGTSAGLVIRLQGVTG